MDLNFFYFVYVGIKYDAEKEARQLLEARQRELQRIEEAKQKIADQGNEGKQIFLFLMENNYCQTFSLKKV